MGAHYDVIIIGLGAMGSAALYQLAKRGVNVLGIDRFDPPHEMGSSHGKSRAIREAYFEHPSYVPLVQRAYELWDELEADSGQELFTQTGALMMGRPNSAVVQGAMTSADEHNLPYKWLSADAIRTQYACFNIDDELVAVLEHRAGLLVPETCIEAHLQLARQNGAQICTNEAVVRWEFSSDQYEIMTTRGRHTTGQLVISAGAWIGSLVTELEHLFQVDRQLLFWFEPAAYPEQFSLERLPIFVFEYEEGHYIYGFPDMGDGFKIAKHYSGEPCDPDLIDREVHSHEIDEMRDILESHIPYANGKLLETAVCMYTNTSDLHFVLDEHPQHEGLWIVSPCSGHGFKFASAIGELVAKRVVGEPIPYDMSLFKLDRFGGVA